MSVFNQYAAGFSEQDVLVKDSRNGTFQSITITIEAQSEEQLRQIHQDLMDTGLVSMVLQTPCSVGLWARLILSRPSMG